MERRKCLIKSLKNELWDFMAEAHEHCTHSIDDRSINDSLFSRSPKHAVNMTSCGPARDTVLTNRQTEKLNFGTNYLTIFVRQCVESYSSRTRRQQFLISSYYCDIAL